ncbi:hypothetical protein GCM10027446_10210 [Angustibacter peucedani]
MAAEQVSRLRELVAEGLAGAAGLTLDVDRVARHDMSPPHVSQVVPTLGLEGVSLLRRPQVPLATPYFLDVPAFERSLHDLLDSSVAGCAFELRRNGSTLFTGQVQDARAADDPTSGTTVVPWTTTVRMHVASCSKLVTAVALTKALADHPLSADDPVAPWLPAYWAKGPNVGALTFADLMTHRTGLVNAVDSSTAFPVMKQLVAAGVPASPGYLYQNVNFGLCRILVATVSGAVAPGLRVGFGLDDLVWDTLTIDAYAQYVQQHVFAPSGVVGSTLDHADGDALGYAFPRVLPGWNSQDLRTGSGAVGWHLSVEDLQRVAGTVRRGGSVLSPGAAATMMQRGFGVDDVFSTKAGSVYQKTGWWQNGAQVEHAAVFFLQEDMELVVLVNSGRGTPPVNVLGEVVRRYDDCLRPQWHFPDDPTLVPAFVYAVEPDGDLLWYRHDGAEQGGGVETWHGPSTVGRGWGQMRHVFPGGGDVLYAIDPDGVLWWYEHRGFNTGDGLDVPGSWVGGRPVGRGWGDVAAVFSGGDGVIYVVDQDGRLLWYRHHGVATGDGLDVPGSWSGPNPVGTGWDSARLLFSAGEGIIYAVMPDGVLRWYRHRGVADGSGLGTPGAWEGPVDVGTGWGEVTQVFSRGDGVVYAVMADGTLRWFRHDGYRTGAVQWRGPVQVGSGWGVFTTVLALLPRAPDPVR